MSSATSLLGPNKQVKTASPQATASRPSITSLLAQLSPEQREVAHRIIESPGCNFAVSAPPGRGKTFTFKALLNVVLQAGKCEKANVSRSKAIVIAPTNLALMQWDEFRSNPDVLLTTSASLIGRGVRTPKIPPCMGTFTRRCGAVQQFCIGRALVPQLDHVIVLWDEFWNTPGEDVDNGLEILSKVLQAVCTTVVVMGDPVQHKPVDGISPLLSGPFHELSRANKSMLPGLARRPLLKNLMTIPGESRRISGAPSDIAELLHATSRIEALLRAGNLHRADAELLSLQACTAGLVVPPGPSAVYITATRRQQWRRQMEALKAFEAEPENILVTGTDDTDVKERTCIVVGQEHKLVRFVRDAIDMAAMQNGDTKSLPNGMRGVVTKFDFTPRNLGRQKRRGRPRKKRRVDGDDEPPTPKYVLFKPLGDERVYSVSVKDLTTTTAMTTHGAQGITLEQVSVIMDCKDAAMVHRTQSSMVASFVVGLTRAKNSITRLINYTPGLILRAAKDEDQPLPIEVEVADAFASAVQRLTAGGTTSIVPKKVRLRVPSRESLQRQLNAAFRMSPKVRICKWNAETSTAVLASGLTVTAVKA